MKVDEKILNNQYTIKKELGEGSYGKVYLVEDNITKEQYALKVLFKSDDKERFYDEIKILFQLKESKHILSFFTYREENENL